MREMNTTEVIMKIIGKVNPIGETNEDERRYDNLIELLEITNHLIGIIDRVAINKDSKMHSKYKLGKRAYEFMDKYIKE